MNATSFEHACAESIAGMTAIDGTIRFDRLNIEPPLIVRCGTEEFISISESGLEQLSREAFTALQFRMREEFIRDLARMASDSQGPERFVLETILDNSRIAADGIYPTCQDTGTAGVYAWKGDRILTNSRFEDSELLERGALSAWDSKKFRNSQLAPRAMNEEINTGDNSPLACDIFSQKGSAYRFLFMAKGGGSSNKTSLYQETKDILEPAAFKAFLAQAINLIGVSACPPYTIAIVVGGQTPEQCLLAAKLATTGALDALPAKGQNGSPFRDPDTEALVMRLA